MSSVTVTKRSGRSFRNVLTFVGLFVVSPRALHSSHAAHASHAAHHLAGDLLGLRAVDDDGAAVFLSAFVIIEC